MNVCIVYKLNDLERHLHGGRKKSSGYPEGPYGTSRPFQGLKRKKNTLWSVFHTLNNCAISLRGHLEFLQETRHPLLIKQQS
jgi:hypothetical protein